jgi:pimeloyl-ACP methyl ester carboxylesterase
MSPGTTTTTEEEENGKGPPPQHQHHFVLVHGACHGAWCWYKVATLLASAGHRVTALDMAGCGASPVRGEDVASFEDYSRPLLDAVGALPPGERAVLVGHSFGGQSLALAMERYPERVAVAVFVSAAMPAAGKPMALVLQEVRLRSVFHCSCPFVYFSPFRLLNEEYNSHVLSLLSFFYLVSLVLVVCSLIPLVVFFLSCTLLFYSIRRAPLRKNTTKGIIEHTTKTKLRTLLDRAA